jgi:hypothetical protein
MVATSIATPRRTESLARPTDWGTRQGIYSFSAICPYQDILRYGEASVLVENESISDTIQLELRYAGHMTVPGDMDVYVQRHRIRQ